jgi:hypothetical protein
MAGYSRVSQLLEGVHRGVGAARGGMTTGSLLVMCVDTTDMHKRALWAAWETKDGRCARWAALTKINARIRAADLTDITAYDRPREIETRLTPVPGQFGIYTETQHDPEDPNYRPAEPVPMGMVPGKRMWAR